MDINDFRRDRDRNQFKVDWKSPSGRTLFAMGFWMRAGVVGAFVLVSGLLMLINGEGRPAAALALTLGGGTLAIIGWRRAKTLLDRLDTNGGAAHAPALPATAMSPRQARLAVE